MPLPAYYRTMIPYTVANELAVWARTPQAALRVYRRICANKYQYRGMDHGWCRVEGRLVPWCRMHALQQDDTYAPAAPGGDLADIGAHLSARREQMGVSLRALSKHLQCSTSTLQAALCGKNCEAETLLRIAAALGVHLIPQAIPGAPPLHHAA